MLPAIEYISCKKRINWLVFAAVMIGLTSGCASKETAKKDTFFEKWKVMAEEAKTPRRTHEVRSVELPEEGKNAVLKEKREAAPERPLPVKKISLKMHNADVAVLLRALARLANQNIMINASVEGKININVKDAPWDQVFRAILRTQGLTYSWEGEIIRIMTVEDMEHDLKIEAIQEKRRVQELGLRRVEPLLTKIIHVDYAEANKLKENLQEFLTKDKEGKPRGSIMVDEHTNALIIQAIRDDVSKMIPLIENLDRPTPQILIEANIVETNRETARELGIQWGGLYHRGDYWITPGANAGGVLGQSLTQGVDPASGMAANFPAQLSSDAGFTLGFVSQKLGKYLLNVQLSALQDDGKLNILSNPSITTLDNQTAYTENGEKIPYVSTDKEGNREVKFEDAVLRLEIKPHVIEGKNIKMDIVVKKDEVDTSRTVDGNPFIIKKRTETTLIVQDSETIVISGLTKQRKLGSESGVPGLKEIPVLGYLFKGQDESEMMEEVLIFMTPHILREEEPDQETDVKKQIMKKPLSSNK